MTLTRDGREPAGVARTALRKYLDEFYAWSVTNGPTEVPMFEPLPARFSFPESEQRVLEFWDKHEVFTKSLELRQGSPRFVFYEGPPTANGVPHPGHCLTRAIKDLFPRYKTMRGFLVERKAGWDTHGLPVEIEVCKELGIHSKEEIEEYGVAKFIKRCTQSVFRYVREWEHMTDRLGFWINLDEAYVTFHQSYVESVWWGLKTLFERDLLYQGHKVVWWWAQGGTALSAGEVGEGYRTVEDPSVYIRFPLVSEPEARAREGTEARRHEGTKGEGEAREGEAPAEPPHAGLPAGSKVSLLVWTTTPWTLISNHFAAVHPLYDYALVHDQTGDEYFYIATDLVDEIAEKVKHSFKVVSSCRGKELIGLRYVPPFDSYHKTMADQTATLKTGGETHVGWRVLPADFVTLDTGSGIVHQAPAYGEVDFDLLQEERGRFAEFDAIPLINAVAPDGTFTDEAPEKYRGRWVKDCDEEIMQELWDRGIMFRQELVKHEYPFCPRSEDDPLIQYARRSWFVRTSKFKEEFLKNNDAIYWLPDHIREGRFGDFLRNNVDWALSRERYWGTPLPIWVCEKTGKMEAIGSYAELLAKPGVQGTEVWEEAKKADPELPEHLKVHKPYIDAITYDSPFLEEGNEATRQQGNEREGKAPAEPGTKPRMRRVPEVIDCWWDAGSMPFAQWGFPHVAGSVQTFADRFPCDFISEAIDQTRGWFYGLLAISTLLYATDRSSGSVGVPPASVEFGVPPASPRGVGERIAKRSRLLPHWEAGGSSYVITFRVATGELSPEERSVVLDACRHWDQQRLLLHAVVVMPEHVHVLMTPLEKEPGVWWSLADLMHSIKSYTAKQINALRGTSGIVWQREYFDRIIRNADDFEEKWNYVVTNPLRRGLPDDYRWVWVEPSHVDQDDYRRDADAPRITTDYPMPYKTCIVLGHVMGEDGLKMSKRTKNYKEPDYVFDHYGADAMRWYFFSAQTPWTSTRFQEAAIRDAQREFLVRLYNVFSFFNIYANIDSFTVAPVSNRWEGTGYRPVPQRSQIDRWVISELHRTIRFVREKMDAFENFPAAGQLKDFVDALSNWYVRRSRERFWKGEKDQDKWDAYNTLYETLVTLSKLVAPFTPFFAETMYQNLVRHEGTKARRHEGDGIPLSVHLCDYPKADEALIDEKLAQEMDLVRQVVSTGRAARTAAKLKVRQPLAQVEVILGWKEYEERLHAHTELIAEELNVRKVEFTHEADHYVRYQVKPNFAKLGPKFGKLAPKIGAALNQLGHPAAARKALLSDGELALSVDGQSVKLTKEDVDIRLEAKAGWSAAQGRAGVVVVSTELTPKLREEGLIRELIHQVQGLRKQQELAYEARITLHITGPEEFLDILRRFTQTVSHECLATQIEFTAPPTGEPQQVKIEGHEVALAVVPR